MCGNKYVIMQKNKQNLYSIQSNFTPYKIVWKKNNSLIQINKSKYKSLVVLDSIRYPYFHARLAINKKMELFCVIYDYPNSGIVDSQVVYIFKYDYSSSKFLNHIYLPKDTLYYQDNPFVNCAVDLDSNSNLFLPDWKNKYFLKIAPNKNISVIDSNVHKNQVFKVQTIESDSTLIFFHGGYIGDTAFRLNHKTSTKTFLTSIFL